MELILQEESISAKNMKNCHRIMMETFGDELELVGHWGPVQMNVFNLEYRYLPLDYTISLDCERGFITIQAQNKDGEIFWPLMIFPEARYYHFADVEKDILQLATLMRKAIKENLIIFEPTGTTAYANISQKAKNECDYCSDVKTVENFLLPREYEQCIEYIIKDLIEEKGFFVIEGNCPIGEHMKDGFWAKDIIYHTIKCPECGQVFTCIVNTYRGGGSFESGT